MPLSSYALESTVIGVDLLLLPLFLSFTCWENLTIFLHRSNYDSIQDTNGVSYFIVRKYCTSFILLHSSALSLPCIVLYWVLFYICFLDAAHQILGSLKLEWWKYGVLGYIFWQNVRWFTLKLKLVRLPTFFSSRRRNSL